MPRLSLNHEPRPIRHRRFLFRGLRPDRPGGATKRLAWDDAMNPYLLCAGAWTAMAFVLGCVAGLTYWSWR